MPARKITMRKIKEILRLTLDAKLPYEQIAASLQLSKGVISKYVKLASTAGLDWPAIAAMDEGALERQLLGPARSPVVYAPPDYGQVHVELRGKGVTLMLLWEEYCGQWAEDGEVKPYRYSQFCESYRRFARTLKRSMRQVHRAGDKLFIDYAGPTIALSGGGKANIFVAAMGASGYAFAWATPAQTTADWLEGCCRALGFYGGVPQLIVPDNPRAVIAQASRYEPRATDTVLDFAVHYGCSILPARAYHPQDKAKAESTVQIVERWIMARLRHQAFHTVHEVNAAMAPLLEHLNNKPFQKLPGSRASVFAAIDAPALMALPLEAFELAIFKTVKVHIDYHVEFEGHRYSVPHALVGQTLELRVTRNALEILNRGQRVASHARNSRRGGFTTTDEHMPENHRAHAQWSPDRLIAWGEQIGVATARTVRHLLERQRHPEHAYRACLGLLSLSRRYSAARLEAACLIALQLGTSKYSHIKDILVNRGDQLQKAEAPEWTSPQHAHVRGPGYYQ
ncbi:IS21 family transposase [Polaromonas sp. CG_23.6]|uniref:IS21 family transposase n=1 Tax=Polaromonas sp. CG_23.6 TaxID=2760709 RepID=UPI002476FB5C|nr:IS21 family transposase [Polaromonas sp. CG_23.6]MDH6186898.1 transposase [Polaromonas sp. CG_23.6]